MISEGHSLSHQGRHCKNISVNGERNMRLSSRRVQGGDTIGSNSEMFLKPRSINTVARTEDLNSKNCQTTMLQDYIQREKRKQQIDMQAKNPNCVD